jgi:hypothetical protein
VSSCGESISGLKGCARPIWVLSQDRRRALFSGGGEVKRGTDLLGQKSSRALQATSNSSRARSPGSTRRLAPGGGNGTTSSRRNLGGGSPKTQSLAEGDDDAEATDPFSGDLGYDEGGEGGLPDSQQRVRCRPLPHNNRRAVSRVCTSSNLILKTVV